MDMLMKLKDQSTLISSSMRLNLSMVSSKESRKHKLKQKKQINQEKRTRKILPYGKLPNQENQSGNHLGEKEDQDGISNAQLWPIAFWEEIWIFILEASISSSLIMKTRWHSQRRSITIQIG